MNYSINLEEINEYNTHHMTFNPQKTAFLIIEMQETFRTDLHMISEQQINNVNKLIRFGEQNNSKIIFVRHNDSSTKSQNMINWWGDKLEYGSDSWQIIKEIPTKEHLVLDKTQYSAFFETDLEQILKSNGTTDVVICGVMTNCCCETAARDAFMRGFNVFFINDATSTLNSDLHMSAIKNIAFGFAYVLNTDELTN